MDFLTEKSRLAANFFFNDDDFSDKKRMGDPIFKSIGYPSKIYYSNKKGLVI